MKNKTFYLLGLGLQKHVLVLSDKKIKYEDELTIDDQYAIIVLSFNDEICTSHDKETKIIKILKNHQLSLYDLNVEDFYQYETIFEEQVDKDVFFHCLQEHYRMNQISDIIKNHQYDKLARFMKASYNSYKYYYQTSTQKQDYLILLAEKHHAISANISDNHIICLVEDNKKQRFINKMKESFKNTYGKPLFNEVDHD